jgi:hypothetical protein
LAGALAIPAAKSNTQIINKAKLLRCLRQGVKIYQSQLLAIPKGHEKLRNHSFEALFLKAEADHLKNYKNMNSWTVISHKDPRAKNHQILDSKGYHNPVITIGCLYVRTVWGCESILN